jgi:hypothetical protein
MTNDKELERRLLHPTGVSSLETSASGLGLLFSASTGPLALSGNNYLGLELSNPSGSDKEIYVAQIIKGAVPSTSFTLIRNGTFAGGALLTPFNSNFGSSNVPEAKLKAISQGTDPFSGAASMSTIIQSSGSILNDLGGRIILPPGTSLGIRAVNNTTQPNLLAVTICWWEQTLSN